MKSKTKLEMVGGNQCGGGTCPAVYKDSDGKVYVQGNKIDLELRNQAAIGGTEDIVEVTPEMLEVLKKL